jgi:hypothetical protein
MEDIEEIFSNLLRKLPLNNNKLERHTFNMRKTLRGGWNGHIFRRGEIRIV